MVQTQGQVLYENAARDAGVINTYSGITVTDKEFQNSYDWRDFSIFAVEQNEVNTQLDITLLTTRDIDNVGLWVKPLGSGTGNIELFYESAPAVFTSIQDWDVDVDDGLMIHEDFSSLNVVAGRKIRWQFNTGATNRMLIRQLAVGERLDFPIGQRDGVAPTALNGDMIIDSNISVNGSVVGRSVRRMDRMSTIELEYLTEAFVRGDWQNFTTHAISNAFFYRQDKINFPLEANFSIATIIPRPMNMMPPPLMKASLPLKNLVNADNI